MSAGTILMVEPNPGILIVARNVLTRAGHKVVAVAQAKQGIELVQDRDIDLVLMDARQADPHLLAALHGSQRVPIVLTFQRGKPVDGQADVDETQPGVATADFLEKPFSPERLLQTVERVMRGWTEETSPLVRNDTLVSVRVTREEDAWDNEQTDIFPYAHLLDTAQPQPTNRGRGAARDARVELLAERLRTNLDVEGLEPRPELLSACLRACDSALEVSQQMHVLDPEGPSEPAIEGAIPGLSIDQVLQLAMAVEQPSRCRIAQNTASIDVYYDSGTIAFARQSGLPDGFLLGHFLVSAKHVREKEVKTALTRLRDGKWLGERLVAAKRISETELTAALRMQTEELVYEVIRWSTGRFAIFANHEVPPEGRSVSQKLAVPHLLLEGMRRLDEWRRIQPTVGELDAVLTRSDSVSPAVLAELSPDDREVLQHVDGRRTVAELVRTIARPTYQVYRLLHGLATRRLIVSSS